MTSFAWSLMTLYKLWRHMALVIWRHTKIWRHSYIRLPLRATSATLWDSPPPRPCIFWIILFWSTTMLTGMTGISLHMQWPLTSQTHGNFSQREQLAFHCRSNSTPLSFITEEIWPGRGLNPGLPNDSPGFYPLLHKLMLICQYFVYQHLIYIPTFCM
jgi:hypothetical protein